MNEIIRRVVAIQASFWISAVFKKGKIHHWVVYDGDNKQVGPDHLTSVDAAHAKEALAATASITVLRGPLATMVDSITRGELTADPGRAFLRAWDRCLEDDLPSQSS